VLLKPLKGAYEWTAIITSEKKRLGAGMVVYENKLGGRVAIYAAPDPACLPRNYQRQTITHKAIDFVAGGKFTSSMVTGGPHLIPIHFEGESKHFVIVLNGSPDPAKPVVRIGDIAVNPTQATILAPLAKPVKTKVKIISNKNMVKVTSQSEVPYLGFLILEW